jgi:hypothetical protein
MTWKQTARALCMMALLCACALGQTSTGSLLGTAADPSNAAVAGAQVELKNSSTGVVRTTTSGPEGLFRFNSLEPDKYTLTLKATGFKAYQQTDIEVTVDDVRDLGRISLALGALTEEISVTAEATPVQTASSEKSTLVDGTQFNDIALKGRDLMQLLNLVPGVMSSYVGDTTSELGIGSVQVNGAPVGKVAFMVDGIRDLDTDVSGSDQTTHYEPNMDSVSELRVMTSNYQAEFGSMSSGSISVVTKRGTRDIHGTAWANKRHEMFNANSFFNNFNGLPKSQYRFFVWGYSVGGPVYIPKILTHSRNKFYFFASQEYTRQKPATTVIYDLMPTALERKGNFSQSLDTSGKLIPLFDPTTRNPIPGNIITQAASPIGLAMMNWFPLPNRCDLASNAAGCYNETDPTQINRRNYETSFTALHPRRNDTVRVDANVSSKVTMWFRWIHDYDLQQASPNFALLNSAGQWTPSYANHPNPGHGYAIGITYTISPSLVNEFTLGKSYDTWDYYASDQSQVARSTMGNPPSFDNFLTDPKFLNDQNLERPELSPGSQNFEVGVPNITGTTTAWSYGCSGQCPYTNFNDIYTPVDSISWVKGAHSVKAGIYAEHTGKYQYGGTGNYLGAYDFSSSSAFPIDTGYGNANMYLGNLNNYTEGGRVMGDDWFTDIETFVQDSWRVSRRLTLELGVRFYHMGPWANNLDNSSVWVRSTYNPATAAREYQDGCTITPAAGKQCPTANEVAYDPPTGYKTYPALANTLVPASVGGYATTPDPFDGAQVAGVSKQVPLSMFTVPFLVAGPRAGLAWDVFGNGKTAIRAGWGQFFQRDNSNQPGGPRVTYNQSAYYSNITQVPSLVSNAAITPIALTSTVGTQKQETSISTSFGIQQAVGFRTVIDVSYVGAFRSHSLENRPVNPIPIYSEYNPVYEDLWSPYTPQRSTNDNNLRPLAGIGNVSTGEYAASTNYNSLQASVRRNMTRHLSYGLAYTFSKTMSASPSPYWADKYRNYGASFQGAPSVVVVNYVYEAPNLGQRLNLKALGWVTDHWSVSGITQWQSEGFAGAPSCCSFQGTTTANPAPVFTGSAESARLIVTGNPTIPLSQVNFTNTFNPNAFAFPDPCSWTPAATPQKGVGQSMECFGNAGAGSIYKVPIRINNWNMTFAKNFPLKGEKRVLTFRAEMYNIFNHTQFSGVNTTIQYNLPNWQSGVLQQTNNQLGRFTATQNPRQMSMSLRFQF